MSSVPLEVKINLPKEARQEFFFLLLKYMYKLSTYVQLLIYVQNLLYFGVICGSAEQPLQAPDGRALNQPKPHPPDRTV